MKKNYSIWILALTLAVILIVLVFIVWNDDSSDDEDFGDDSAMLDDDMGFDADFDDSFDEDFGDDFDDSFDEDFGDDFDDSFDEDFGDDFDDSFDEAFDEDMDSGSPLSGDSLLIDLMNDPDAFAVLKECTGGLIDNPAIPAIADIYTFHEIAQMPGALTPEMIQCVEDGLVSL